MTTTRKPFAFDPFQGDFGSQDDVVLKNKMGVARARPASANDCA